MLCNTTIIAIFTYKNSVSHSYPHYIKTMRKWFDREPNDMPDAGKQPVMTVFLRPSDWLIVDMIEPRIIVVLTIQKYTIYIRDH